jgi:K+-transporting ATPase ATPase B chain
LLIQDGVLHQPIGFNLQITLWLWFTVLFANFAEAMAEGRGKAQADTLRKAKGETIAYRYKSDGTVELRVWRRWTSPRSQANRPR